MEYKVVKVYVESRAMNRMSNEISMTSWLRMF